MPESLSRRAGSWLAVGLLASVALVVFFPALGAYFLLDDFGLLLLARHQDHLLAPLVVEHMPGSLYYRPAGAMTWWLSERVFGNDALGHYVLNLALHVANSLTLCGLVVLATGRRWPGIGVALLFAVHPVGIGTAIWLSDRFDLLATLFGLLAVVMSIRFSRDGRWRNAVAAWLCLLIALLSKETALAAAAAVFTVWLLAGTVLARVPRAIALFSVVMLIAAWLMVRASILSDPSASLLFGDTAVVAHLGAGIASWMKGGFEYVLYWPRLDAWQKGAVAIGVLFLLGIAIRSAVQPWDRRRLQLLSAGIACWLMPALLQAPMTALLDVGVGADTGAVQLALDARYFYLSLAGFLLVVVAMISPTRSPIRTNPYGIAAVVALALAWGTASHRTGSAYRDETIGQKTIVEAALRAVATLDLSKRRCSIFLLDVNNWMFAWVADQAVKAAGDAIPDLQRCLIQTEHTPWYHVVPADSIDEQLAWPLVPLRENAVTVPWLRIGGADVVYLNAPADVDADDLAEAYLLSWRDGGFIDISADVLARRRTVALHCNRRVAQCPQAQSETTTQPLR